ncbi:enoyl-CoA hydratase/isomerase family protein [Streptomyces sp. CRN 30]|uniref:enoyl-CoA hydratase/isomerase family protein n=1 Tax=Streptomyces sp. CRN 30 TaxID=3075613 RepID=UPI002A800588|nr:enoyl-CoA hydratase/isomerase family protein [Streptomyces sp. CRN 30]
MSTPLPLLPAHSPATLTTEEDGRVLHVRLTPDGASILTTAAIDDLINVLHGLHDRPDLRVLVLSSTGEDFCLGADRQEFRALAESDPTGAALRRALDKAHRLCQALENTHAVTIARLHGGVIGAGLALAAYCDLRVGADTCRFRMPEVGVGLPPAWGGAMGRLITEAGAARIRELFLTCDEFDAETAHRLSILHRIAPPDRLDAAVTAWTRPLSRRDPESLLLTKRMLAGYTRADRVTDATPVDSHLLASVLSRAHAGRRDG